ncbi:MAG: hypothetical protein AAFR23_04535, partial [Pseudomonadota bacterium]
MPSNGFHAILRTIVLTSFIAITSSGAAFSQTPVFTGGVTGAYQSHFCPSLKSAMSRRSIEVACTATRGTVDNMARVTDEPASFAYGQLDVFALQSSSFGGRDALTRVRTDDVRECVFAVTKERDLVNYGEIAVFASQLSFFVPPASSGSTNTFRYLQQIDPEGLGEAQ